MLLDDSDGRLLFAARLRPAQGTNLPGQALTGKAHLASPLLFLGEDVHRGSRGVSVEKRSTEKLALLDAGV